jgi:hypothetical protein
VAENVDYNWATLFGKDPVSDFFGNPIAPYGSGMPVDIGAHQATRYVSAGAALSGLPNDEMKAEFNLCNNTEAEAKATLIYASYSAEGKLLKLYNENLAVPALTNKTGISFTISADWLGVDTAFVKAFVWRQPSGEDDFSFVPLCPEAVRSVGQKDFYDNLALKAVVRSTDSQSPNLVANAVSGNRWTDRWAAATAGYSRWIEVDLGQPCDLSNLDLYWFVSGTRSYQYKVWGRTEPIDDWSQAYPTTKDFSADPNYTLLVDKSGNTVAGHTTDSLVGSVARYIVIQAVSNSGAAGNASIYSIEISGQK